jgi:hypothetical protein
MEQTGPGQLAIACAGPPSIPWPPGSSAVCRLIDAHNGLRNTASWMGGMLRGMYVVCQGLWHPPLDPHHSSGVTIVMNEGGGPLMMQLSPANMPHAGEPHGLHGCLQQASPHCHRPQPDLEAGVNTCGGDGAFDPPSSDRRVGLSEISLPPMKADCVAATKRSRGRRCADTRHNKQMSMSSRVMGLYPLT